MDNNIVDKIELLALQVYPKDEFYIGSPGVLFDQKQRDRNKWIEGYKAAQIKLKPINDSLLEALKRYENQFQKLFTVPLGKKNEESLRIWFSIASSDAKSAIQKAEQ